MRTSLCLSFKRLFCQTVELGVLASCSKIRLLHYETCEAWSLTHNIENSYPSAPSTREFLKENTVRTTSSSRHTEASGNPCSPKCFLSAIPRAAVFSRFRGLHPRLDHVQEVHGWQPHRASRHPTCDHLQHRLRRPALARVIGWNQEFLNGGVLHGIRRSKGCFRGQGRVYC